MEKQISERNVSEKVKEKGLSRFQFKSILFTRRDMAFFRIYSESPILNDIDISSAYQME